MWKLTLMVLCLVGQTILAQQNVWVSAYYRGQLQNTHLHVEDIDFTAITHIIHFALLPRSNGTLDDVTRNVTAANADTLTTMAHAANKRVLICVGGANSAAAFLLATTDSIRPTFINNLVSLVSARHYDGVDIDWENLVASDTARYALFVTQLKSAMQATNPAWILSTAAIVFPSVFGRLQSMIDQINVMTYDLSGPYPGWVTWFNSPIHDGGYRFHDGRLVPSIEGEVDTFLAAGVPASKLGIGIDFNGAVWSGGTGTPTGGVTAPRQAWTTPPSQEYIPYYTLMDTYYQQTRYRWDSVAQVPYLSIDSIGSAGDKFISYDNQTSCENKVQYLRNRGIGGLIIWELNAGWRTSTTVHDSLLRAVKAAVLQTGLVGESADRPENYVLKQNYPNPFNPSTTIRYDLLHSSFVTLTVFNTLGQQAAQLVNEQQQAGYHEAVFRGDGLASGVYFYRLSTTNFVQTRKLVLLR